MEKLTKQTESLKQYLDVLLYKYENGVAPKNIKDRDFFIEMKTKTQKIYDLLEIWEENALKIVKEHFINVHPQQISSTKENMELIILHSYYIDARRKRYMELNQSSHYIFDQLLRNITF